MVATATATSARATTTIRVSVAARDRLQEMARDQDRTVSQVLERLIEMERRERFWQEMEVAVERLRADPEAWADYHAEAAVWENGTIGDGLDEYADVWT